MTEELLMKAADAQKEIRALETVLYSIEKIQIQEGRQERKYNPFLRFVNRLTRKDNKEVREAAVFLFDGVDLHGTEVPVDDGLLGCLKIYCDAKLKTAKSAFDALGREDEK